MGLRLGFTFFNDVVDKVVIYLSKFTYNLPLQNHLQLTSLGSRLCPPQPCRNPVGFQRFRSNWRRRITRGRQSGVGKLSGVCHFGAVNWIPRRSTLRLLDYVSIVVQPAQCKHPGKLFCMFILSCLINRTSPITSPFFSQ